MAVRGLGCPVRFTITAGQKGDAPQAAELIEGLPAEVFMADTAYDADHLRQAIAAKDSKKPHETTSPSSPSQPSSYGCDKCPHRLGLPVAFCVADCSDARKPTTVI